MSLKSSWRHWLRGRGVVVTGAGHRGVRYLDHPPTTVFESTLLRIFPDLDGLQFLQVGANDGQRVDPLHPFIERCGWSGVLLEPVPANFEQLTRTCAGNPRLQLVNAALDARTGTRTIYFLRPGLSQTVPDWAWGLASFDRARVAKTLAELNLPPDALGEQEVATTTWPEVWRRLPGGRCDLLVLDTEGYDLVLLRNAGLAERRPRLIHFEHGCVPRDEQFAFYRELAELGYELATDGQDTTAWLPS